MNITSSNVKMMLILVISWMLLIAVILVFGSQKNKATDVLIDAAVLNGKLHYERELLKWANTNKVSIDFIALDSAFAATTHKFSKE